MKERDTPARFIRFSVVGLLGITLQLVLLTVFTKHFRIKPVTATPLAVEVTLLHNFLWHEGFTWRDRPNKTLPKRALRLCRFHLSNGLVSLLGNRLLTYFLVERLKAPTLPSALAAIALCSLANFALAHCWVYAPPAV